MEVLPKRSLRDSFDRFGDDLTELLLSYLPVGDKFRFECLSKQWQRLVFNRQHRIVLDFYEELDYNTIKTPKDKHRYNILFEHLFRKLEFLKDIECHHYFNTKTFESIINDCRYIEKIGFNGLIKDELLNQLFRKFGQRLLSVDLSLLFNKHFDNIFKDSPNLRHLKINKHLNYLNETYLPKLIDIYLPLNVDPLLFTTFTEQYYKQIESIVIRFDDKSSPDHLKKCLTLISRYPNLESLKIKLSMSSKASSPIDSELRLIGIKCKSLKRLSIRSSKWLTNDSLLSVINQFQSLTRLSLTIDSSTQQLLGTIADLNNCSQLNKFKLEFNGLTDETFKDIHLFLPNLKIFESNDCVRNHLTDETLISFSRLQCLRSISMIGKQFTESGALDLINVCPQIQIIDINYEPSQQSVDALSRVARNRPKYLFKLFVNSWPDRPLFKFNKNNVPINLSIIRI